MKSILQRGGRGSTRVGLLGLLLVVSVFIPRLSMQAAEAQSNLFTDVRFPVFRNHRLVSELQARTADALGLTTTTPKIEMEGVRILVYDRTFPMPEGSRNAPPVRMEITSKYGTFLRAEVEGVLEDIVILSEDVLMSRYVPTQPGAEIYKTELESTMRADRAVWNEARGTLNCEGDVIIIREGNRRSVMRGRGLVYKTDDKSRGQIGLAEEEGGDLGGTAEFTSHVKMTTQDRDAMGRWDPASEMTVLSKGRAIYNFNTRVISFSEDVSVIRSDMEMQSDFLEVHLAPNDAATEDGTGSSPPAPAPDRQRAATGAGGDGDNNQEVRQMTAWSRPGGTVTIHGRQAAAEDGTLGDEFHSVSQNAFYDATTGELLLTTRDRDVRPVIRWAEHTVTDQTIQIFLQEDKRLLASGGNGEMRLRTGKQDAQGSLPGSRPEEPEETRITYTERLYIDQLRNISVFTGNVVLRNPELTLDAQKLTVTFLTDEDAKGTGKSPGIQNLTAEEKVELVTEDGKRVIGTKLVLTPNRAEIPVADEQGLILLDHVVMSERPAPEVFMPGGGYFQARMIVAERYLVAGEQRIITRILATGPGSGVFAREHAAPTTEDRVLERPAAAAEHDTTTVRYSDRMVYDELIERVVFYGDVFATNRDQVLRSNRLIAYMDTPRIMTATGEKRSERRLRKLTAVDRATMHWGTHHSEAERIDRDIPENPDLEEDKIILRGTPERPARIWEEAGSSFSGRTIIAATDGSRVFSSGGGTLIMNDQEEGRKIHVTYGDSALYTAQGGKGAAVFRKDVVLVRDSMTVTGDQMDVLLEEEDGRAATADSAAAVESLTDGAVPSRMRQVTVKGNVVIRQGNRIAIGSTGRVDVAPDGSEIMTLEGGRQRNAEVRDNEGFTLRAPVLTVRESIGIIQARGPGMVQLDTVDAATREPDPFEVHYEETLVYNMLARRIRFDKDVIMKQRFLRGAADSLIVFLVEAQGALPTGDGVSQQMEIDFVELNGRVRFKRFDPANPQGELTGRDGTFILSYSDSAHYHPTKRFVSLISQDTQSRAIRVVQQQGQVLGGEQQTADRIHFNIDTAVISPRGNHTTRSLTPAEAARFLR